MSPITSFFLPGARRRLPTVALSAMLAVWPAGGAMGQQAPQGADPSSRSEARQRELDRVIVTAVTDRWAALGLRGGDVVVYDLAGGKRYQWTSPAFPLVNLAVDSMGIGAVPPPPQGKMPDEAAPNPPIVLLTVKGPGDNKTTMHVLRGDDGLPLTELRIPGAPVALAVSPGEGRAFVITGSGPGSEREGRTGRWTLREVDLTAVRVEASTTLTGTVYGAALSPDGEKIFVGLEGAIRSFNTRPLQSSWMLRSPGRNRILAQSGPAGSLVVIRDSQLAVLNPDSLPGRDPVTGASPEDDAMMVVDLPFIGRFMDIDKKSGKAVVLDARGSRMATVDLARGALLKVQQIPEVAAASFHPFRDTLLLFHQYAERVFEMLPTLPDPPEPETETVSAGEAEGPEAAGSPGGAGATESGAEETTEGARDAAGSGTAPAGGGDPPEPGEAPSGAAAGGGSSPEPAEAPAAPGTGPTGPGEPAPARPGEETLPEAAGGSPEGTEPSGPAPAGPEAGARPSAPSPAPPEPDPTSSPGPAPDDAGVPERPASTGDAGETATEDLHGRIQGDLSSVEAVVLFGPDNILREHARIRPGPDGRFTLPRPPEGRYRVLVRGAGGAQLRVNPPMRQMVVGQEPVPALDFNVEGVLPGHLKPE